MTKQEILFAIGAVLVGEKSKDKRNLSYLFEELKEHLPINVSLWFGTSLNRKRLTVTMLSDFTSLLDAHLIEYEIEYKNDCIVLKKGSVA